MGRLEGLRAVPIPPDLKFSSDEALGVSARAGAFHSDRLRYGRWLLVRAGGADVFSAALYPTVYAAGHPSLVLDVAFFGAAGWMVAIDSPRVFPAAGEPPSPHEARVAARLAAIGREHAALAVPLAGAGPCILSSAEAPPGVSDAAAQAAALAAFTEALTAHLDLLMVAPLDAAAGAVAAAAAAQAALAARLAGQMRFMGSEALEAAFGPQWVDTLRAVVLEDSYGLPSPQQLDALAARAAAAAGDEGGGAAAGGEFIYIDPSQFFDIE